MTSTVCDPAGTQMADTTQINRQTESERGRPTQKDTLDVAE